MVLEMMMTLVFTHNTAMRDDDAYRCECFPG